MAAVARSTRRSTRLAASADPGSESKSSDGLIGKVKEEVCEPEVTIKQEPLDEDTSFLSNAIFSPVSSLAVLAEVAQSCTTDEMPVDNSSKVSKQATQMKKAAGSKHAMTLNEIWALTDKQLVQNFSELTSNEMTRNFAYTCYLMPEKCAEIFTSFGNESKAKTEMQYHLLNHLRILLNEAKENPDFVFTAQTVQSRRKYGMNLDKLGNRKRKSKEVIAAGSNKRSTAEKPVPESENPKPPLTTASSVNAKQSSEPKDEQANNNTAQFAPPIKRGRRSAKADVVQQRFASKKAASEVKAESSLPEIKVEPEDIVESSGTVAVPNDFVNEAPIASIVKPSRDKTFLEMFKKQPYVDHSYLSFCLPKDKKDDSKECGPDSGTSRTAGWKYAVNEEVDEDDKQILSVVIRVESSSVGAPNKLYIPIVRVPKSMAYRSQANLEMETDIVSLGDDQKSNSGTGILQMNGNRCHSECGSDVDSDDDDYEELNPTVRQRKRFEFVSDPVSDTERKLALKYMNELRAKRKEELLICKICKNKQPFTATATLLYHYRSHAGIKPFVCMICNTTFTRQHSLNYHMLIHNNQNRFTCKDCGRKFRHPSHFKEHLRRHTGETPFLCTDCPLRFKTRNTYKRHLRTRHGKLLLATGIHIMPREEFLKVRTKPYLNEKMEEDTEFEKESIDDDAEMAVRAEQGQKKTPKPVQETSSRKPAILSHSSLSNRSTSNDTACGSLPL